MYLLLNVPTETIKLTAKSVFQFQKEKNGSGACLLIPAEAGGSPVQGHQGPTE